MATGWIEKRANGKFRACWRTPEGKRRSKTFDKQRDAKRHLAEQQAAINRGAYIDDAHGRVTFGEYAEHHYSLAKRRLARTTFALDTGFLRNHVLPRWGHVQLARVAGAKREVEAWIAELGEEGKGRNGSTLSPTAVEKIYGVFRRVMQAAHDDGLVAQVPFPRRLPIKRGKRKPVRFLTESEVEHLASCIDERYRALVYLASYGGFRMGELAALRLDDVDWARGTIRVDEGVTDVNGYVEFEETKTARGHRTVPVADLALEALRTHIDESVGWDNRQALLFTAPDGGPLRRANWRKRVWLPAIRAAQLSPLTPHDLRHTAASLFIAAGANPWMLAEVLGHRDTRMVDRVYGHLFERDKQALRDRMSARAREAVGENFRQLRRPTG